MRRDPFDISTTIQRIRDKYQCEIVLVSDVPEMLAYIDAHPESNRIGFLLKTPEYLQQPGSHHSPIFFERKNREEHFFQFDSLGAFYLLPSKPGVQRMQYYSPFVRQVNGWGCAEDGIKILVKCFQEASMLDFCSRHSEQDLTMSDPLTEEEIKRYREIQQDPPARSFDENKDFLSYYGRKWMYRLSRELGFGDAGPVSEIYRLTSLPSCFLAQIEHYATMRFFQQHEPAKFQEAYKPGETVAQHLARKGTLRSVEGGDIKGQDFGSRRERYAQKNHAPGMSKAQLERAMQARAAFKESNHATTPAQMQALIHSLIESHAFLDDLHNRTGKTPFMASLLHRVSLVTMVELARYHVFHLDEGDQLRLFFELLKYLCRGGVSQSSLAEEELSALKIFLEQYPFLLNYNDGIAGWSLLTTVLDSILKKLILEKNGIAIVKLLLDMGASTTEVIFLGQEEMTALALAQQVDQKTSPETEKLAPLIEAVRRKSCDGALR